MSITPTAALPQHEALSHNALRREQQETLNTPTRPYGLFAKAIFGTLDLFYGRPRTIQKFKVLEVIARMPYQAWEHVGYISMTHMHSKPKFARRIFEFVKESREQQDNEQWHLLILEELLEQRGIKQGFIRYRALPQILAFVIYHVSWLMFVIDPKISYKLNADFEDHAEHEYMKFVAENPKLETEPFTSSFAADYGSYQSLADLFRQIGVDERHHKLESLERMLQPRFA
ncbi:MAG TPA: alternative oxidase [Candidatus Kapabacteria bacterium]|nr:alternative oxidase [Candidatus Kapabacteria bacterium]